MSEEVIKPGKHIFVTPEDGATLPIDVLVANNPGQTETFEGSESPEAVSFQPEAHEKRFGWKGFYKRAKQAAFYATVGAGLYATVEEYSPNPKVSSAGTDALIGVNDFLRDNGEAGLITVAGLAAVVGVARWRSTRVKEMLDSTQPAGGSAARHRLRKILPPLIVTATAVGTGLGAEAGRGANEPIDAMVSVMHADRDSTYAVVQHDKVLPFNHSAVSDIDVTKLTNWSNTEGYNAAPFYMYLGDANNSKNDANPSSTGIIAMPDELLPQISDAGVSYNTLPVLTTEQFAQVGDTIAVEEEQAEVVATSDNYPGLDRTSVLTTNSELEDVVLVDGEPHFGVMISGVDSQSEINEFLKANGIDAAAIPVDVWQEKYNKFWDRSVTPLSMEFMLLIGALGSIGAGYIRSTDILRRRKDLADQNIMGVDKDTEAHAEYVRTVVETAKATAFAAAPTVGFIALTNSAQYGVALEASPAGLGAGAILAGGSLLLSTVAAGRMIKKMDSANEAR